MKSSADSVIVLLERLLAAVAVMSLAYFTYVSLQTVLYQAYENRELDAILTNAPTSSRDGSGGAGQRTGRGPAKAGHDARPRDRGRSSDDSRFHDSRFPSLSVRGATHEHCDSRSVTFPGPPFQVSSGTWGWPGIAIPSFGGCAMFGRTTKSESSPPNERSHIESSGRISFARKMSGCSIQRRRPL